MGAERDDNPRFHPGGSPRRGTGAFAAGRRVADRDAVPAGDRAGHGEGVRGHRLLPLFPPAGAERGGRRSAPLWHVVRGVSSSDAGARAPMAACDAGDGDPRYEARRGWAAAHRALVGAAACLGPPRHAVAAAQPPPSCRDRWRVGARPQCRIPVLSSAGRRLAAWARSRRHGGTGRTRRARRGGDDQIGPRGQGAVELELPERRVRGRARPLCARRARCHAP